MGGIIDRLVEIRKARGLSQKEVAGIIGASVKRFSNMEEGHGAPPSIKALVAWTDALGLEIRIIESKAAAHQRRASALARQQRAVQAYLAGEKIDVIAIEHGYHRASIAKMVRGAGLPLRKPGCSPQ